jgi:phage terminase large subunit
MPFVLFQRQRDLVEFLLACLQGKRPGWSRSAGTWARLGSAPLLGLALAVLAGRRSRLGIRKEQLVDKIGDRTASSRRCGADRPAAPEFWPAGSAQTTT